MNQDKVFTMLFCAIGALILTFIGILVFSAVSTQNMQKEQFRKCSNAGGTYIEGKGMGFCVKEFLPMEDK